MSPRTLFLSRLIGLYCILVALSMMTRRQATVGDGDRPSSEPRVRSDHRQPVLPEHRVTIL